MTKRHQAPQPKPQALNDIDYEERAAQMQFLRERWESLAALAWESYQAEGRGAVILTVTSTAGQGKTEAFYASERALQPQGIQWPDVDTASMVAEYQPEQEIVIAVPRENGGNSTYRMNGPISPPEAHRQQQHNRRKPSTA